MSQGPPILLSMTSSEPRPVQARYSVTEVCRILRPGMTPRRVHYWLHTGLLGQPARPEHRGRPTILSFDQVVKVRVVQGLRDELGFSLSRVRGAIEWLLDELVEPAWGQLEFFRTGSGEIGLRDRQGQEMAVGGQLVIRDTLPKLNDFLRTARQEWEMGVISISGFPDLISDASIMGGAPVVSGTRIETAFVAHLASAMDLGELAVTFEHVDVAVLREALSFEGVDVAA